MRIPTMEDVLITNCLPFMACLFSAGVSICPAPHDHGHSAVYYHFTGGSDTHGAFRAPCISSLEGKCAIQCCGYLMEGVRPREAMRPASATLMLLSPRSSPEFSKRTL